MARSFVSSLVLCIVLCLVLTPVALADAPGPQGGAPADAVGPAGVAAPTGGGCPGTLSKTYSGWEFRTLMADTAVQYASGSGSIYRTAGTDLVDLPVDLPQGARIIAVNFYYYDNLDTNMGFWLSRYTPWTGGYGTIANVSSSGTGTSVRTAVLAAATACDPIPTVNNTVDRYALEVMFRATGSSARLYGAAVIYTVPTLYLPLVLR